MNVSTPSPLRLGLLRSLSSSFPDWGVWKNVDRTLEGAGDIDSLAPASSWERIGKAYEDWALSQGFEAVVACRHAPGVLLLQALSAQSDTMTELDICDECHWRGGTLFTADRLAPLMVEDPRGFRCLRSGAQGLFLLLLNGVRRGGRSDVQAIRDKHVIELLESDRDGAISAAQTMGSIAPVAIRLAEAVQQGRWERGLALRLEASALIDAFLSPKILTARVLFRAGAFRTCPVIRATREGRQTPRDIEVWLDAASRSHRVVRA